MSPNTEPGQKAIWRNEKFNAPSSLHESVDVADVITNDSSPVTAASISLRSRKVLPRKVSGSTRTGYPDAKRVKLAQGSVSANSTPSSAPGTPEGSYNSGERHGKNLGLGKKHMESDQDDEDKSLDLSQFSPANVRSHSVARKTTTSEAIQSIGSYVINSQEFSKKPNFSVFSYLVDMTVSVISMPTNPTHWAFVTIADHTGHLTITMNPDLLPSSEDQNLVEDKSSDSAYGTPRIFTAHISGRMSFKFSTRAGHEKDLFMTLHDRSSSLKTISVKSCDSSACCTFSSMLNACDDANLRHFAFPVFFAKCIAINMDELKAEATITFKDLTGLFVLLVESCPDPKKNFFKSKNFFDQEMPVRVYGSFTITTTFLAGKKIPMSSTSFKDVSFRNKSVEEYADHCRFLRETDKRYYLGTGLN